MNIQVFAEGGPVLIFPNVIKDERGYFYESFNEKEFKEKVADVDFVQDNESLSSYGTIRGLHFQKGEHAQAKLVRVVKGSVIDFAVDIRSGETFGNVYSAFLSEENKRQFFIPRGFAHGFMALSDNTIFQYKCDNFYCKESEGSIFIGDTELNIPWAAFVEPSEFKISDKDLNARALRDYRIEIGKDVDEQPETEEQTECATELVQQETNEPTEEEITAMNEMAKQMASMFFGGEIKEVNPEQDA